MTNFNYLISGIFIATTLFTSSCGENTKKASTKNSPEFNILASVKNPAALLSVDLMDLLKKSNVKESQEMPAQFKMIVNSQIDRHFNSENQGFELEGNIPLIVATTESNDFDYAMAYANVLDAEKVGPSLCMYFDGTVEQENSISILEANIQGSPLNGHFVWDNEKLIFIVTEKNNSRAIALAALASKDIDAPDNSKISDFLTYDNDFTSLLFMDQYTSLMNKLGGTKMKSELAAAYEGLTVKAFGNFNEGNFSFKTDLEGENFINSKFNNLKDESIDQSFYNYLTENNQLIAFGTSVLNIEAIVNAINETEYQQNQYESELAKIGLKKEDLALIFDGQFSASLMDVESIPTEGYEGNVAFNQDRPKVLLTCGLIDTTKLTTILSNIPNVKPVENYFLTDDIYMGIKNNKLFASLNEELIKKLVSGETLSEYKAKINKPLYGTIITNTALLPESFKASLTRNGGEELLTFYNEFEEITFNGDIHHTEFKVVFTEQSKNSFEILSNLTLKNLLPLLMTM